MLRLGWRTLAAMARSTLLVAALGLVLAACGAEPEEPERPPQREGGAPALAGPLVYSRGGGIAGGSYRLTIAPDGRGRLETFGAPTRDVRLEPAELAAVAERLRAADLAAQPARFAPERPMPDAFGHRVVYAGKTVTVSDGASGVPDALGALVGRLSAIVDRLRR